MSDGPKPLPYKFVSFIVREISVIKEIKTISCQKPLH